MVSQDKPGFAANMDHPLDPLVHTSPPVLQMTVCHCTGGIFSTKHQPLQTDIYPLRRSLTRPVKIHWIPPQSSPKSQQDNAIVSLIKLRRPPSIFQLFQSICIQSSMKPSPSVHSNVVTTPSPRSPHSAQIPRAPAPFTPNRTRSLPHTAI